DSGDRRHGAVVEIRRRRPDAVQRRRLVAGVVAAHVLVGQPAGLFFREPALVVILAIRPRQAIAARRVSADFLERNDLARIGPVLAVGAVAARAVLAED